MLGIQIQLLSSHMQNLHFTQADHYMMYYVKNKTQRFPNTFKLASVLFYKQVIFMFYSGSNKCGRPPQHFNMIAKAVQLSED